MHSSPLVLLRTCRNLLETHFHLQNGGARRLPHQVLPPQSQNVAGFVDDFYSFEVKDAKGRTVSLEKYRGKASLVVNVASHCEHTEANFRFLQDLHRELGTAHFNVLAFPCGQFGTTELGLSRDIEAFAKNTYGLTFPFFGKIRTFGSEAEPAFKFLTDSVQKVPKWNFWKFLVDPEGKVVRFWKTEEPMESIRQEAISLVRQIILKKRAEL
uniref:Glutathione peroxidase n=1 Tax=Oryzias latipes TaxID=8090 RepID=A0A3P9KEU2_ORYLA